MECGLVQSENGKKCDLVSVNLTMIRSSGVQHLGRWGGRKGGGGGAGGGIAPSKPLQGKST